MLESPSSAMPPAMSQAKPSVQSSLLEQGIAYLEHWMHVGRTTGFHWLQESCQTLEWEQMAGYFQNQKAEGAAKWMRQITTEAKVSNSAFENILTLLTQWLNLYREKDRLCSSCQHRLWEGWGKRKESYPKNHFPAFVLGQKTPISPVEKRAINWAFSPTLGIVPTPKKTEDKMPTTAGFALAEWSQKQDVFPTWEAAHRFFQTSGDCPMCHWQKVFFVTQIKPGKTAQGWWVDADGQACKVEVNSEKWEKWIWFSEGAPCVVGFEKTGTQLRCLGGLIENQWLRL